jgi:group I intron endonuclease
MIGIYKITNLVNNKVYIGQSWNIEKRLYDHKCYFTRDTMVRDHLYKSFLKYGSESFKFEIIQEIQILDMSTNELQNELDILEKHHIALCRSENPEFGYNKTSGGEHFTPSDEIRNKISEKIIARWSDVEYRKKQRKGVKNSYTSDLLEKRKQTMINMWNDLEYKSGMIDKITKAHIINKEKYKKAALDSWSDPTKKAERLRKRTETRKQKQCFHEPLSIDTTESNKRGK